MSINDKTTTLRVTVVDDSPTAVAALEALVLESGFTVAGTADSVERAEALVRAEGPDLVLSDVHLIDGDGLELTRRVLRTRGVPIVLVTSADAADPGLVFRAMEAGALELLPKPPARNDPTFPAYRRRFESTLRTLAGVPVIRRRGPPATPAAPPAGLFAPAPFSEPGPLVALGASTGGPVLVAELLRALAGRRFGAALVAQHIGSEFTASFRAWLAQVSGLTVRVACDGEPATGGVAFLAPGGCHLSVDRGGQLKVAAAAGPGSGSVPSIDRLFESLAQGHARRTVAVLLSGMGRDGAQGLAALRAAGAHTIVQAPATAAVDSMPRAALDLGAATETLTPEAIGEVLSRLPRRDVPPRR